MIHLIHRLTACAAILGCCFCYAQGPIVIVSSDMPVPGEVFYSHRDTTLSSFSIGPSGPNRTWDFSMLSPDATDTSYAAAPSSTPYASDFPNSNLALTPDFTFYLYYRNTPTALKVEGFANNDPNLGIVTVNFNPIPDQYRFPTTYPGNFSGSSGFQESKPFNQLPPSIQQQINSAISSIPGVSVSKVRVTFTSTYTDTIDAWGLVTTPLGTYKSLRRKRVENSNTKIEVELDPIIGSNFWQEISNTSSTTTDHSWLAKNTKLPLILLGYDSLRNIVSASYSNIPPLPVASFSWSNPSGGLVAFTDNSLNTPSSFLWDFGDGTTSSQQHPNHTYTSNGRYYVCLTATNAQGSDTYCDSVEVTRIGSGNNPPIAVDDSVQIVYPDSGMIAVLNNDIDPDGDSLTVVLVFPAANGTTTKLPGGVVQYKANAGFRGFDSFQYIVEDNGTPTLRDTATVVVHVVGPPFADFSYAISGMTVTYTSLSSGADSVAWNLGDGTTASGNIVVHTYATKSVYTVCLTAFNGYGSDANCKNVDLNAVGISSINPASVSVFPNPAHTLLRIETDFPLHSVEILECTGKRVLSAVYTHLMHIAGLPAGFYLLRATGMHGEVAYVRLIKK
ncbi:MAG: hypothetical protein KatS3mg031_2260 [Chitinophagales bacterium]|nr:MAG: hypothetical protein KatS3mg031_2260 [Chitinophagales bacterium]